MSEDNGWRQHDGKSVPVGLDELVLVRFELDESFDDEFPVKASFWAIGVNNWLWGVKGEEAITSYKVSS